jgi:preprotein translocase subunit SecG
MKNALTILQVIVSITLIISVLAQPAKTQGFSLLTGASDTFYAKNKTKTFESTMAKLTVISAILFAAITVALNVIK